MSVETEGNVFASKRDVFRKFLLNEIGCICLHRTNYASAVHVVTNGYFRLFI